MDNFTLKLNKVLTEIDSKIDTSVNQAPDTQTTNPIPKKQPVDSDIKSEIAAPIVAKLDKNLTNIDKGFEQNQERAIQSSKQFDDLDTELNGTRSLLANLQKIFANSSSN